MRISDWSSDVCSSDLWGQCVGIDDNAVNFGGKMRRGGGDKAPGLGMDRDAGEAGDDLAVGFFLQPRLDRFPVGKAERARQCRGKDGFPDAGVGAGDDEAGHAAAMAAASAPVIASMLSSSTWSVIAMRRRAVDRKSTRLNSSHQCAYR